jgi:hypothetical protein
VIRGSFGLAFFKATEDVKNLILLKVAVLAMLLAAVKVAIEGDDTRLSDSAAAFVPFDMVFDAILQGVLLRINSIEDLAGGHGPG